MTGTDRKQNWKYYLVAPKWAVPLWFGMVFCGLFLLGTAVVFALATLSGNPNVTISEALGVAVFGGVLVTGGFYLRRTNPHAGILEPTRLPGESEKEWQRRTGYQTAAISEKRKKP